MAFLLVAWLSMAVCTQGANPLGPGKGPWSEEDPSQHGLDPNLLAAAREQLFNIPTRNCMVVIKDGALVYESYGSSTKDSAHAGYSMTKTLGALIIGQAVGKGVLDIDADITTTYGIKSPRPYPVTARQIMSQALDGQHGPGEAWKYDAIGNRWINNLTKLMAVVDDKPSVIWRENFHHKLGLADSFNMSGTSYGGSTIDNEWAFGAEGTCRDWARIGQLMLNGGRWLGEDASIVPADYVKQMVIPQTKFAPYQNYSNPGYGLLTWLNPHLNETAEYPGMSKIPPNVPLPADDVMPDGVSKKMYFMGGALGQIVLVVPDDNLVAVSMGTSKTDLSGLKVCVQMVKAMCPLLTGCSNTSIVGQEQQLRSVIV